MQTPRMLSKYGLNIYKDENTDKIKSLTLVLQFNSLYDKVNRVDNFRKKIEKIDNLITNTAFINHKSWLHSGKLSGDSILALQKKSLYYSYLQNMEIDHSKPPSIKIKVPYYNNEIQNMILYDKNHNKIEYTLEELEKLLKGEVIIKCIINPSIYIINQNFGITYNIKALQIIDKIKTEKKSKKNNTQTNNINNYFIVNDANKSESSEIKDNSESKESSEII